MPDIASWVRAADPAANFIEAYRAGSAISSERARLNMQAQQSEIELQAKQQQLERESAMQSQKLEMDRQLRLATMGLQQQRLEAAQTIAKTRAEQAARQYSAQQAYEKALSAGVDPSKALMMYGPGMGSMASAMAAAERVSAKTTPQMPASLEAKPVTFQGKEVPGLLTVPTPTGYRTLEQPGFVGGEAGKRTERLHATQNRLAYLRGEKGDIVKAWGGTSFPTVPPKSAERAKQWQADKQRLEDIQNEMGQLAPKVGAEPGGGEGLYTGKVVKGYVFLGGDPSKRSSWKKQDEAGDEDATE